MLYTAEIDPELRDWLRFELGDDSDFVRPLAELAMKADVAEYSLLRPILVALRSHNRLLSAGDTRLCDLNHR